MVCGLVLLLVQWVALFLVRTHFACRWMAKNAASQRRQQLENQPYTVRLGDFNLLATASAGVDYNDNINLAQQNPRSDIILRPLSNFDVAWPITDLNALSFSLGVGYESYLRYSEYSRAVITPGSQINWDFFIKDIRINLHDRFSYQLDPTANGEISGRGSYGGFQNVLGFTTIWDLRNVVLSFGYDHVNFISSSSVWKSQNSSSDFVLIRGGVKVHPSVTSGIELSGGPTSYEQKIKSDNSTFSGGAYADWNITEHIKLEPRAGYYLYFADNNGLNTSSSDYSGPYFNLKMSHKLNQYINYSIEGGRRVQMGISSALTQQMYGSANINWQLIKKVTLGTGFLYEDITQPIAVLSDEYDRISAQIRVSYQLREKLTSSLDYQYWIKESRALVSQGYEQNRIGISLSYRF